MSDVDMSNVQADVPYGTLDLLILKSLDTMGPLHGYGLARRIERVSQTALRLSQGSIYPALVRLEQQGWIDTTWGVSETGRKVKIYKLTPAGVARLGVEVARWHRTTSMVARFLDVEP
jgi:PadR family transcriptional regulator PadR